MIAWRGTYFLGQVWYRWRARWGDGPAWPNTEGGTALTRGARKHVRKRRLYVDCMAPRGARAPRAHRALTTRLRFFVDRSV